MAKVLTLGAFATLFVLGLVLGGTASPSPAFAQSIPDTCEQDRCDHASWWQFWADDECVMNTGHATGCNVTSGGCHTYDCGDSLGGGGGGEDPNGERR
ncbi:MAG: hypothetical protein F4Z28_17030 [Gammaproteobacteria bacterium]|nr:hypothetical protein [Gammaproteobacteria bacterium]